MLLLDPEGLEYWLWTVETSLFKYLYSDLITLKKNSVCNYLKEKLIHFNSLSSGFSFNQDYWKYKNFRHWFKDIDTFMAAAITLKFSHGRENLSRFQS